MKIINAIVVPSRSITPTFNSAAIDASQMVAASFQVVTAGGTLPSYAVKIQASNDIPPASNAPQTFTPTNWSDLAAGQSVTVIANGVMMIPKFDTAYRWLRVVGTFTSGTGTSTVTLMGICV